MSKTLVNNNLGPAGTPQEVKDLRKSSFELHNELGTPVMFKHRWNEDDVRKGLTWPCPLHDDLYAGRDSEWDDICFGTGFVGGYADGQIVFVTIQDTQESQIKIGPTGILTMDMHPALTAPWLPKMGNGDLIITVEFDPTNWQVVDEEERYVLRDVTPISMRGPGWGRQRGTIINRQRISQESMLDKLPISHPLYRVPIEFDYTKVPTDPTPPFEPTPPEDYTYTAISFLVRIHGIEDITPEEPVIGTPSSITQTVRMYGSNQDPGVHIFID